MTEYQGYHEEYEEGMYPRYNRMRNLGGHTSPQSANQLEDFSLRANEGIPNIELMTLNPEVFETIPREHLKEINRLAKLTETNSSLHVPLIEPSGFTQQGWSEQQRKANEQEIWGVVERAHELDDRGNVPVNIHGANIFGAEWEKSTEEEWEKEKRERTEEEWKRTGEEEFKEKVMPRVMTVVNQETGQIMPLEYERKQYIEGKEEIWHPLKRLKNLNVTQWDQEKLKVMSFTKDMRELNDRRERIAAEITPLAMGYKEDVLSPQEEMRLKQGQQEIKGIGNHIHEMNNLARSQVQDMYDKLSKFHKKDDPHYKMWKEENFPKEKEDYMKLDKERERITKEIDEAARRNDGKEYNIKMEQYKGVMEKQGEVLTHLMADMPAPELFKPVNEMAIEKASDTLSNVALRAFKKFGEKAPMITVENSYPQLALSRGEDLKKGVEETRKKFAEKLVKESGVNESEAKRIAEKLVGATWDVGHINMLRRGGYDEKDILEETKKIAPLLKHVHLTDNFGYHDSHLPPGMGNVPIKKMLEVLEKGGANPDQIRHIVEAGGFIQHFKRSPWPYSLEGLDSPLYRVGAQPSWTATQNTYMPYTLGYNIGYGDILPEQHHRRFYGAGWAGVPKELGGQTGGGDKGRFAQGGATEE